MSATGGFIWCELMTSDATADVAAIEAAVHADA
jgi:hypothetical protein